MKNDTWKTDLDQLIEDEQSYTGPMIPDDHLFLSLSEFISKLLSSQEQKIREEEKEKTRELMWKIVRKTSQDADMGGYTDEEIKWEIDNLLKE